MNRTIIGKMIGYAAYSAFLLIGCKGGNVTGPDTKPEFGGVTALEKDKIYVAYPSPDGRRQKLDTVTLSFDYNSSKVKSILVKATVDSAKSWLAVASVTPNSSNGETVRWIPRSGSSTPNFFGVKRCFIRIIDTVTNAYIDSDTFPLVGSVPVTLLDSLGNDTFLVTDTITVRYGTNMDLASNIQTYFKTDAMAKWVEFTNASLLSSPDGPTILNKQKRLIPESLDSLVKAEAHDFGEPIRILFKDYSAADCQITTGYITIRPAAPMLRTPKNNR